ncbi:MAG: metal ABC transporter permease [Planctomycetota bacterium]
MLDALAAADWGRTLLLTDYNTRIAVIGAGCLGAAAGLVGTFLVLRRRALMADTLGHSTLPGVGLAFLVLAAFGKTPDALPWLLLGAAATAGLAAWLVAATQRIPRIREDAALAIVLGVLFGLGLAILGVIQQLGTGHAAGLGGFIDGSVASMRAQDSWTMVVLASAATLVTIVLFKALTVASFDPQQARLQGLPVRRLEFVQLGMVVVVTVAGIRAVGLILIIALLIVPPAAARPWSNRLSRVAVCAAGIGAFSGIVGAWISALVTGLPTGPVIVLVAVAAFGFSLLFGRARGILRRRGHAPAERLAH